MMTTSTVRQRDVRTERVTQAGVLPDGFYSTTNLPTEVLVGGKWIDVEGIEMDVAVVVDHAAMRARAAPMHEVGVGDAVVVGHRGIRVTRLDRAGEHDLFAFMQGGVSSERAKVHIIREVAKTVHAARATGGRILLVLGPAIVHTAAREYVAHLIRGGYVQVIFAGNAVVAHDAEAAMFGTSLGVDLQSGEPVRNGHHNHLRAINAVRAAGSLPAARLRGVLGNGIVATALEYGVELVLAGSIRDDGPMPGVITDTMAAQAAMRRALPGVEVAILVASMLHGIATGNLLPARVRTIAVDINPAVVTKLVDRGTTQAIGVVTDAEHFLHSLLNALEQLESELPTSGSNVSDSTFRPRTQSQTPIASTTGLRVLRYRK